MNDPSLRPFAHLWSKIGVQRKYSCCYSYHFLLYLIPRCTADVLLTNNAQNLIKGQNFPLTNLTLWFHFIGIGPSFSEIWPKVFFDSFDYCRSTNIALCSKLSMKMIKTCKYETLVPKLCCVLRSRNSNFENPNPS